MLEEKGKTSHCNSHVFSFKKRRLEIALFDVQETGPVIDRKFQLLVRLEAVPSSAVGCSCWGMSTCYTCSDPSVTLRYLSEGFGNSYIILHDFEWSYKIIQNSLIILHAFYKIQTEPHFFILNLIVSF